jgi:hypothetical protein
MEMSHKVVSAETIKNLEETVAFFDTLISNVKACSVESKEGIKSGFEVIRDWEFDANVQKNKFLNTGKNEDANVARSWQGKQEAYQNVLTLFEAPKDVVDRYSRERDYATKQLAQYKELEQRD